MLELTDLSLVLGVEPEEKALLTQISLLLPQGHFCAVIGPSGSGKSTLLKAIAGLREHTGGSIHWAGRNLAEEEDLAPHEVGYVPQFSIAYDHLTVWESVATSMHLRVSGVNRATREENSERILEEVGLHEIADREVRFLSGGQKRRLALAIEMVSQPALLLCDEVTSGLDPKAEDEIVRLMKRISKDDNRIVLTVTHSLRHLDLYDSVIVMHEGHLAYQGPAEFLLHYFDTTNPEELFPRLSRRSARGWSESWLKHRHVYLEATAGSSGAVMRRSSADTPPAPPSRPEPPRDRLEELFEKARADQPSAPPERGWEEENDEELPEAPAADRTTAPLPTTHTPGALVQFFILLRRRWKLFVRDRTQLWLHLSLMFGFPCLVVIFALNGLPQIQNLSAEAKSNVLQQIVEQAEFTIRSVRTGSLISGLVMFQVILLTLMGSNNGAREIAAERLIFEKEKFGGVRPIAYIASKAAFLSVLVLAQSIWMAVFVKAIIQFPGDLVTQAALLVMVNAAMTSICLGISSLMKSPEQASLVSVYLVGLQLPLSGAVLALPELLGWLSRPFIAAYWSWSGYLQTMRDTRYYDVVLGVTQTRLTEVPLCLWVLGSHVLLGLILAYFGTRNSRWE